MKKIALIIVGALLLLSVGVYAFYTFFSKRDSSSQGTQGSVDTTMNFFVTSVNPGDGGNLGGVKGADAYCASLAEAAGVSGKTWRAYLSSGATAENPVVNARDRIGTGPWYNARRVLIASDVEALHTQNNITKDTALTETGAVISGRGDDVNMHDILTGSNANGYYAIGDTDLTCNNWTSGNQGSAMVGHHDRIGFNDSEVMKSWNASHRTTGCSLEAFNSSGGAGLFYCFAE